MSTETKTKITTSTIGRFLGGLLNQHATESGDHGFPVYRCDDLQEEINDIEVDASDPDNVILKAEGARFALRIVRVG